MLKQTFTLIAAAAGSLLSTAHALGTGDIAFTAFNADEDGLAFVTFVDLAPNTKIYFTDNEWNGSVFNTGESYNQWVSGNSTIAAGTVIRFSAYDKNTLSANKGSLSRLSVTNSGNWGIANSNETIYAYMGSSATAKPDSFLAAITNGSFAADGSLTNTGLSEGSSNAIRLNQLQPTKSPDFGEYTGPRSGKQNFAEYKTEIAKLSNWTIDTVDGSYANAVPNTSVFAVTPVPEPETYALMLAGLMAIGMVSRRRKQG